jgi:hypothetical protein
MTPELRKWYGSGRWRKRSKFQLQQEPWCRSCLTRGEPVVAVIADHIFPHRGDAHQFWFGALQSLCRSCHESGKKFEEARGFSNEVDITGMPVDKRRHPVYVGHLPDKPKAPPVDPVDGLIPDWRPRREP